MKMILTLKVEWEVVDLQDYKATTLEEAVVNQRRWIDEGTTDIYDFVGGMEVVSLEGVK